MNRQKLRALIALNVVLLGAVGLMFLTPTPEADAQRMGAGQQYMIAAGQTFGREEHTIYIVELTTARMIGVIYRANDKQLEVIGGRELGVDLRSRAGLRN